MSVKKVLFPLSLAFTALVFFYQLLKRSLTAAAPAPVKAVSGGRVYDAIDAFILKEMGRIKMPGASLAIVEGERIVHQRGFGRAGPHGEAPTPQTPFFIGSLTKSITALAVMQLVEAGKIELDSPVQCYLPWFRVADPRTSAEMTVRHLLNQTSGLPESAGELELADADNDPDAAERQARGLASLKLAHPPGAACEYANMNYNLLGLIIEAVTGETYAEYVQKHIFDPLEMSHTYTSPALARRNGLAKGHQYWFGRPFAAPNLPLPAGSLPSGQLISSAEDMAHFLIAQLNGGRYGDVQILSSDGIEELQRGALEYKKMGVSTRYGMGWFVDQLGETKIAWHSGTTPDFGSYMGLLPEQKKGLVLLCNGDHYWLNPVMAEFGTSAVALLAGQQYTPGPFFMIFPGALRWLLLIPVLQIVSVAVTLRLLRRWRLEPERRPGGGRSWRAHVLLPLIPDLLIASTLIPMLGRRRGFLKLYMPDYAWVATVCGTLALAWGLLRTGLIFRAQRRSAAAAWPPLAARGERPG